MYHKMTNPFLSIVIVTYNSGDTLGDCLDSLSSQTLSRKHYEVIVVDNGSSDGSVQVANHHEISPKVIAWGNNLGFGRGNNLGVGYTKGEVLVFINPDAALQRDALKRLMNHHLEGSSSIGIIGGKLDEGELTLRPLPSFKNLLSYHRGSFTRAMPQSILVDVPWVCGAFLSIKESIFMVLDGFDQDYFLYYEETDLCKRVREIGYRVCVATDVKASHAGGTSARKVSGGVDSTQNMIPRFRYLAYLIFMRKHHGVLATLGSVILESILKSLRMLASLRRDSSTRKVILSDTGRDLFHLLKSAFETRLGTLVPRHPWSVK